MSCIDPANEVVAAAIEALARHFDPDQECPPVGGGSTEVRFIPGDGEIPIWVCDGPLLTVRVVQRYRSTAAEFPEPLKESVARCASGAFPAVAVELAVTRCSVIGREAKPSWSKIAAEAGASLDDSWRIEKALCDMRRLRTKSRAVNTDNVTPSGPEGGFLTWAGFAYVQIVKG
ncbi:MAG: hypothetical protein CMH38_03260 [Microbacterium sp.]|nr:hypothetical protein [Microbacterium sp.]MAY48939.1 hypothetical protein [Microbacterium sp.]MBS69415.1 hypothetical protein [Pseudomonas sp.]